MVFSQPSAVRFRASRRRGYFFVGAAGPQALQFLQLVLLGGFVDVQQLDGRLVLFHECVHAHDFLLAGFNQVLVFVAGVGDFGLRETAFDGRDHAAHFVDAANVIIGALFHFGGEAFDEIAAAQRIGNVRARRFHRQSLVACAARW